MVTEYGSATGRKMWAARNGRVEGFQGGRLLVLDHPAVVSIVGSKGSWVWIYVMLQHLPEKSGVRNRRVISSYTLVVERSMFFMISPDPPQGWEQVWTRRNTSHPFQLRLGTDS